MNNKNIKKTVLVLALVFSLALFFVLGYFTYYLAMPARTKTLMRVSDMLDKYYVGVTYNAETGAYEFINYSDEDYARALVDSLTDAYSDYFNEAEYTEFIRISEGKHYGIGVSFAVSSANDLIVYNAIGNSPAYRAGIKSGEKIVKTEYNGVATVFADYEYGTRYEEFIKVVTSVPVSTPFNVYVDGKSEPYVVTKENYTASYVEYADNGKRAYFQSDDYLPDPATGQAKSATLRTEDGGLPVLADDTAYVKLEQFEGNASSEFASVISYMRERGKTKLILDLRNNGGGQLTILSEIASYLVTDADGSKNVLVASAKDKSGATVNYYTNENNYKQGPFANIAVLANKNTASASEALIGAMISAETLNESRLIITKEADGTAKTYGKGIMQSVLMSSDFSFALKLTTAVMYWPNGNCIHARGITTTDVNSVSAVSGTDAELQRAVDILAG